MRSCIKRIIIFNSIGDKREVKLKEGINIITGESKTGKSALIEIIDYCLCSRVCTIPKGVITDFGFLYVLVLSINNNTYIVSRKRWNDNGKMSFCKIENNFDIDTLSLEFFDNQTYTTFNNVKYEIECALGLFVTNIETADDKKSKKASLRNMVSYLFQHQNLMASKFALFYRFSDYYKRKDVIEQFPIFAGIIGQEYYSYIIKLNNLNIQLQQKQKKQKASQKIEGNTKNMIVPLLQDYFALLDIDIVIPKKLKAILKLASELPEYDETKFISDKNIIDRYHKLNIQKNDIENNESKLLLKIKSLKENQDTGNEFSKHLIDLKEKTEVSTITTNQYICPFCGQNCMDIVENDMKIKKSSKWLENELNITKRYTRDFTEDIRKCEMELKEIENEKKNITNQITGIKEKYLQSNKLKSKKEKIDYTKAKIGVYVDIIKQGVFELVDEDIEELQAEINLLKEKIEGFDVNAKIRSAESFLSQNMNKIAEKLDFEDEYKPINLNFGLVDNSFDLYQYQEPNGKIRLYEMGSGANWVSCHIALFLSFLHYFAIQKKSPMFMSMFFDQPSQVYFPRGKFDNTDSNYQSDLSAVNKMYTTIFNEMKEIEKDSGFMPQLIIVDHVDGSKMECQEEFAKHIVCNWKSSDGLI